MSELQTMPLRVRIWDAHRHIFVPYDEDYVFMRGEDDGLQISSIDWHGMDIVAEDERRFIISQDTGLPARDGQHMFTGDIIGIVDTGADGFEGDGERGVVAYTGGAAVLQDRHGEFIDYLYNFDPDALCRIGSIWGNPELLKELNG